MKQDKWARQLHDKLAEHEMAAPEGLWADIEAALQKTETLQKSAEAPQKARFIFMRRWAVAASLVTLLATGGYWWMSKQDTLHNLPETVKFETPKSVSNTNKIKSPTVELFDNHTNDIAQLSPISSTKPIAKTDTVGATFGQEEFETPVTKPQKNQGDRSLGSEPVRTNENQGRVPLIPVSQPATKSGKQASVNLYAINGFGSQTGRNGVRMSDELASRYNSIVTTGSITRVGEVFYLAGYEEQQKHHQPISIGLTVNYPLTDKLSISSGVVFTKQQSDFTFTMRYQQIIKNQTLYYLGVPLSVNYRLWSYKGLNVYTSVGGQADWNISMKLRTNGAEQKTEKDNLQWSVNGSLGIQYNLIPQVGLYAEPGVKYYFDNGSRVQNFFKDKPTHFNLQVGLRFNLDTMLPINH
jgi:hypothetical protein